MFQKKISIQDNERRPSIQHPPVDFKVEEDVDDEVEDLSMSRAKIEKVSPPPSPVPVASLPNSDAAVPAAQPGVIVPPQK